VFSQTQEIRQIKLNWLDRVTDIFKEEIKGHADRQQMEIDIGEVMDHMRSPVKSVAIPAIASGYVVLCIIPYGLSRDCMLGFE
jgi:hypothetical protein